VRRTGRRRERSVGPKRGETKQHAVSEPPRKKKEPGLLKWFGDFSKKREKNGAVRADENSTKARLSKLSTKEEKRIKPRA